MEVTPAVFDATQFSTTTSVEKTPNSIDHLKEDTLFQDEYRVRIVGQILIFILGVPLNSIVIYSILRNKAHQTRVNCLVCNLSAINLVYALFTIPFDISWHITVQWLAGNICCKLLMFIRVFLFLCGPYMLVCISLDRLLAIVFPLKMATMSNVTKIMCTAVYSTAAAFALPQAYFYEVLNMRHFLATGNTTLLKDENNSALDIQEDPFYPTFDTATNRSGCIPGFDPDGKFACVASSTQKSSSEPDDIPDFTQCVTFGKLSLSGVKMYNLFTIVIQFFVPVTLMIVCYVIIILKLTVKHRRQSAASRDTRRNNPPARGRLRSNSSRVALRSTNDGQLQRARNRMISMSSIIVVVYILCTTPYYLSVAIATIFAQKRENNGQENSSLYVRVVSEVLNVCQMTCIIADPLIYGFFHSKPELGLRGLFNQQGQSVLRYKCSHPANAVMNRGDSRSLQRKQGAARINSADSRRSGCKSSIELRGREMQSAASGSGSGKSFRRASSTVMSRV